MPTRKHFRMHAGRVCRIGLVLGLLLLVSRNFVSRVLAQRVASSLLASEVQIDSIFIGWGEIQICGVTVLDPAIPGKPQFEVRDVEFETSIVEGIRSGVWLENVLISDPSLHLHFDQNGNLLSVFPETKGSSEGELSVPIESLFISNAQVVVHQGNAKLAIVSGANVAVDFGDDVHIRGRVDQLVKGSVAFQTRVDATTLEGSTSLRVEGCQIDCQSFPGSLLPESIRREGIAGSASMFAKIRHPAGVMDPRLHPTTLSIQLQELQWRDLGTIVNEMTIAAKTNDQGLEVDVTAVALDGSAHLRLTSDSLVPPLEATAVSEVTGCKLDPLLARFAPGVVVHATARVETTSLITWDGSQLSFKNKLRAVAGDLRGEQVALNEIVCEIQCDGKAPVDPSSLDPMSGLQGKIIGTVSSDGLDLSQLASRSGVPDLKGRIGGSATVEFPLDGLLKPESLSARAFVKCEDIGGHGAELQDTQVEMTLVDGKVVATLPETRILDRQGEPMATVSGFGETSLSSKQLVFKGETFNVDVRRLAEICKLDGKEFKGNVDGHIDGTAMIESLAEPEKWTVAAVLQTKDVMLAGEAIDDVNARCDLNEGVLKVAPTTLKWRENVCRFALDGRLNRTLRFKGDFSAGPIRLDDLAEVASRFSATRLPLTGQATITGSLDVDTKTALFRSRGESNLQDASYAGTKIGSANLAWEVDPSGLTLRTGSNDFLGGTYALAASVSELDWTRATLEAQFTEMQATRISRFMGTDLPVTGTIEGGCKLTSLGSLNDLHGNVWMRSLGLSVQSIPIELSGASIQVAKGSATAAASGQLLRGRFAADANCNLRKMLAFVSDPQRDLRRLPLTAQATLNGLSIEQAVQAARLSESLRPLSGVVHATCVRDASTFRDGLICTATATSDNLRWQQARLSQRATATVNLFPDRIELKSVDGHFADGRLSGRGEVSFVHEPRGSFQFGADHVNLRLAAVPLGRSVSGVSGSGSLRIDGRIGRTLTGRMEVSANYPSVSKLKIRAVRLPIDWSFTPSRSHVTWRCRAGVIEAGDGKINVSTEGDYARSLNMRLTAKLNRIDTSRLLHGVAMGAGILDGKVNLQAKRARGLKQITGNFDLTMSQVDSLQMPVLDRLGTLVSLAPSIGPKHSNDGTCQGRLSGGMVHLDQLAISQSNVQVLMSGSATLDGRLNFDVTAATGQSGPADGLMALADSPLMLAAPAPVALVLKANEAMKDRVVHVHVGGTASRPTLRLQPGKQLTQDSIRFFLANNFGSQVANAADSSRRQNQLRR